MDFSFVANKIMNPKDTMAVTKNNQGGASKIKKMTKKDYQNNYLIETAWEVCNQVGGIYTVIQSKVPSTVKKWNENYLLLGPYFSDQAATIFEHATDYNDPIGQAVQEMNANGFSVYYGTWMVAGRPKVVLFDPNSVMDQISKFKYKFWENHNITLPSNDSLMDQVVSFGTQVSEFLRIFSSNPERKKGIIAHFHEWMAGTPIPEIRRQNLDMKVIFTTHATILGRYLAMNDPEFYNHLPFYNWRKEAGHFNIYATVAVERAAAHGCHIFSTVSEITAKECKYLLGRDPEVVLPNGLSIDRFEALHEFQNLHKVYKKKISDFVMGHFFQNYSFDLDKTLYFFTSGRFEYYNKGYDVTLEALARLNWKMKQENIDMTIVMFLITRNPYRSINSNVLESRAMLDEIQRNCDDIQESLADNLFHHMVSNHTDNRLPNLNALVDDYKAIRLRKNIRVWRKNNMPPIVTHDLNNEDKDPIMNFLKTSKMLNFKEDKVKIVYHPDFVSSSNPLFRMEYYQFVRGCHMGIFPSYYEPWGYTPLECAASGIPSITSDLSGFGAYVKSHVEDSESQGISVIDRNNKSMSDAAEEMANKMLEFVKLNRRDRIMMRNRTEASSVMFGWRNLGKFYDHAYKSVL